MRLEGKVVLVTAATNGIGKAVAYLSAKEGATVYLGARNMEKANGLIEEYKKEGLTLKAVFNDAEQKETFSTMIEEVVENEGRIDVLVNNFGGSDPKTDLDIKSTDYEEFIKTVDMNLASVYISSKKAIEYMAKQGSGSIVNISSVASTSPDVSQIGYGVSKAAINYLTKIIATQAARDNIRCNAVLPGMTATDAVKDKLSDEFKDFFMRHIPIRRMGEPEEIALATVYFASDESRYTTGQILEVSGGFGMPTPVFADLAESKNRR